MAYDDTEAYLTRARASYGGYHGTLVAGVQSGGYTLAGGSVAGAQNMFSALGQQIMPVGYTPPARMDVGFHGYFQHQTGFFRGMFGQAGMELVPRGTTHLEHMVYAGGDFGERLGAGGAAVASTATSLVVGGAAGRMAGGVVGGAVGSILGPWGTAAGAFLGRELGMFAGMAATNTAIGDAIAQRREMQSFLEAASFRFVGAGSEMADPRLGRGMSRTARREAAEFIRERDIRDPILDTGELSQIMRGATEMGLFAGTRDVDDFQRTFKDVVENVKVVSRVLHQTLEEGLKTIKDLKSIGMDPHLAREAVQLADTTGMAAGRTASEMLGIGLQGAEMFRGTGVTMGIGFQSNMMNLAAIRAARDANQISTEVIMQLGGEEAAAQRMTASGLMFAQTAYGRALGGAFFNPAMSQGGFNQQAFMQSMMQGGGDMVSNFQTAAANLGSPANLISFQAQQERFMSQVGQTFGGQGLQIYQMGAAMSQARFLSESTQAPIEDSLRFVLKQQGLSHPEIEARLGMIRGGEAGLSTQQAAAGTVLNKTQVEEAAQNFIFHRATERVSDAVKSVTDTVARPLNQLIDSAAEGAIRFREERLYGITRASARGVDLDVIPADIVAADPGAIRMGTQSSLFNRTAASELLSTIRSGGFESIGITADSLQTSRPDIELARNTRAGGWSSQVQPVVGISQDDMTLIRERSGVFAASLGEARRLEESGALTGVSGGLATAISRGISDKATISDLITQSFGEGVTAENITRSQWSKLRLEAQGTVFQDLVENQVKAFQTGANSAEAVGVFALRQLREAFDETKGQMAARTGIGTFAAGVAERLAAASHADSTGDSATAERLRSEAGIMQAQTGTSMGSIQSMLAVSKMPDFAVTAKEFLSLGAGIRENQVQRGNSALAAAVESQLSGAQFDKLDPAVRAQLMDVTDQIRMGGLGSVTDAGQKLLRETGVGTGLLAQREALGNVERNLAAAGTDRAKIREALRGQIQNEAQLNRAVDMAARGETAQVVADIERRFTMAIAPQEVLSTAGGRSAEVDAEGVSGVQTFAQQTAINVEVRNALVALNAILRSAQ